MQFHTTLFRPAARVEPTMLPPPAPLPRQPDAEVASLQASVRVCLDGVTACESCLRRCRDRTDRDRCLLLCRDATLACAAGVSLLSRESEFHLPVCKLCAEICRACADECERFPEECCQQCARACRQCAEECARAARLLARKHRSAAGSGTL
jgi:hypothetical protein